MLHSLCRNSTSCFLTLFSNCNASYSEPITDRAWRTGRTKRRVRHRGDKSVRNHRSGRFAARSARQNCLRRTSVQRRHHANYQYSNAKRSETAFCERRRFGDDYRKNRQFFGRRCNRACQRSSADKSFINRKAGKWPISCSLKIRLICLSEAKLKTRSLKFFRFALLAWLVDKLLVTLPARVKKLLKMIAIRDKNYSFIFNSKSFQKYKTLLFDCRKRSASSNKSCFWKRGWKWDENGDRERRRSVRDDEPLWARFEKDKELGVWSRFEVLSKYEKQIRKRRINSF